MSCLSDLHWHVGLAVSIDRFRVGEGDFTSSGCPRPGFGRCGCVR